MKALEYGFVFGVGAVCYTLIEILWRGHTHWSMTVTGGVCLALLYLMSGAMSDVSLVVKCALGALVITAVELLVGCIVNLWLHKNVWDYSRMILNFKGQICLPFTMMWMLLSVPAFFVCDLIRKILY